MPSKSGTGFPNTRFALLLAAALIQIVGAGMQLKLIALSRQRLIAMRQFVHTTRLADPVNGSGPNNSFKPNPLRGSA
jgi:hypothetical protein